MGKRILLVVGDDEFEKLKAEKGFKTWEEFLVKERLKPLKVV